MLFLHSRMQGHILIWNNNELLIPHTDGDTIYQIINSNFNIQGIESKQIPVDSYVRNTLVIDEDKKHWIGEIFQGINMLGHSTESL